jgi:hypothetical protein
MFCRKQKTVEMIFLEGKPILSCKHCGETEGKIPFVILRVNHQRLYGTCQVCQRIVFAIDLPSSFKETNVNADYVDDNQSAIRLDAPDMFKGA